MRRRSGAMGETARAAITTLLFTDLMESTALIQRVGDEGAQKLFETHHQLLSDAVSAHRGSGFPSAAPRAALRLRFLRGARGSTRSGSRLPRRESISLGHR